jgi:hypothetical protein
VGFTPQPVEVRLSNLMAFDATAAGNWGCPPDRYPDALALVLDGKVRLDEYVELHPLDEASAVFEQAIHHTLTRRAILATEEHGPQKNTATEKHRKTQKNTENTEEQRRTRKNTEEDAMTGAAMISRVDKCRATI